MIAAHTLWELVDKRAAETPDKPFLVDEHGREATFAEFRSEAERVAAGLADLGVTEGTVVSWQLPTWNEAAVLVAALNRLGAVQNPMVPIYRDREVGFIVRQIQPSFYFGPSVWRDFDYRGMVEGIAAESGLDVRVVAVDREVAGRGLPEGDPATLPPVPGTPDDPHAQPVRYLYYTSGTTSDPKGARHTDATVLCGADINTDGVGLTGDDTVIMIFPFTHIGGTVILESALQVGARLVLTESFVPPDATCDLIKRYGVTVAPGATPIHQAFLLINDKRKDEDLFAEVRIFPSGGAPLPPALFYRVRDELSSRGIVSGYGLTESPLLTMGRHTDPDDELANSEGRPGKGVQLKFVRPDGTLAGPGEEGEIRATGGNVMRGYFDASLDAEAFDEDGWFKTGDLGVQNEAGYVTITGRIKDVIIRKGENISAQAVENILFEHPRIADVAVVGVPDDKVGERACAVVVTVEGENPVTFDEMVQWCRDKGLMNQMIPEQLEFESALPRNNTGKIMKFELRDAYTGSAPTRG